MLFGTFRYRTAAHLRFMKAAAAQLDVMRPGTSELATASPQVLPAPTRLARLNLAVLSSLGGALNESCLNHRSLRSGSTVIARQQRCSARQRSAHQLGRTFTSRNAAA